MGVDKSSLDRLADEICAADNDRNKSSGETGESGEIPGTVWHSAGRTAGESGRNPWLNGTEKPFSPPDYPLDALGPLAEVAATIVDQGQVEPAMAGQSLLAAAALAVQGGYDVQTLIDTKPTSLYLLTIGESGDGKSLADKIAIGRIGHFDKARERAYNAAKKSAELERQKPRKQRAAVEIPPVPYMLMKNATAQGIHRSFRVGVPSQGSFTAEAAVMLCGWGMSAEQRANTAGSLNDLWDGSPISIVRSSEERIQLYDKRFSIHWQIQPDVVKQVLLDPLLSSIGFWPRFLVAWPKPLLPKAVKPWLFDNDPVVKAYWNCCQEILDDPALGSETDHHRVIQCDHTAHARVCKFFEEMEQQARGSSGKLVEVKVFAVRATEQVFRVAGVLAVFAGKTLIDTTAMDGAIRLVRYSLATWQGIFGSRQEHEHRAWAKALYLWIRNKNNGMATETAMLKCAIPKALRNKHSRDTAIAILQNEGLLAPAREPTAGGGLRYLPRTWVTLDI